MVGNGLTYRLSAPMAFGFRGGDGLNKTELIGAVVKGTGQSKKVVGNVVDEVINQVQKNVKKGEKVSLPGFGTFERRQRGARTARNLAPARASR